MNILNVFLALFYTARSANLEINSNVTVEVMFVVSSHVRDELDKSDGTKQFLFNVFSQMKSLYALLDIGLVLFDVVIQDDVQVFGESFVGSAQTVVAQFETVNYVDFHNRLTNGTFGLPPFTTRNYVPDAKLYFVPKNKLGIDTEGAAPRNSICTNKAVGLVETEYDDTDFTTQIAVHELGHMLGALHSDSVYCANEDGSLHFYKDGDGELQFNLTKMPDANNLMHSVKSRQTLEPPTWSECTKNRLTKDWFRELTLPADRPLCVFQESPPYTVLDKPVCGNGFVEDGEECDLGLCCDNKCQFKERGTVCRNSTGADCDYDDMCTGNGATCPEWNDADGKSCSNGDGMCFLGQCKTSKNSHRDKMCQDLFGPDARQTNRCSPDFIDDEYPLCGPLYCMNTNLTHFDENTTEFIKSIFSHESVITGDSTCQKVLIGGQFAMDLPWGTKCGPGSLCKLDFRYTGAIGDLCQSTTLLLQQCPGNGTCSGHGRCHTQRDSGRYDCQCETIEQTFFTTKWHGADCSELTSSLTTIAIKIIIFTTIFTVFAITSIALYIFANRKKAASTVNNPVSLVQANQSETLINNDTE